jgi:N-acetylmuramoyl-L-alanine amidase
MEFDVEVEFAAEATRQVTGGPDALGDDAIDTEMAFVAPPAAAKDSRLAKVPTLPSFPDPLRVVIDPGHGGRDPGAQSVDGTWEKDIVLEVAHELALRTRKRLDVDVVLTRHGDETVSLDDRAAFTTGLDSIFISVHGNACPQSWVEGVQTFYPEGGTFGLQSRRLAHLVHHRVVKAIDRGYGPVHDGGVRPRELAVLKRSEAPSLLVEAAYLSNPVDRQRLDDTDYRSAFVDGVIDGIADYLSGVPAPDQLMVERDPPLHAHRDVHRVPDPRYDPYDDPYRIKVAPASFSAR